jgi:hypothetical protein
MLKTVTIPRHVLIRALTKARLLYIAIAAENGQDPGPDDECWAEFEAVASYVGTTAELIAEEEQERFGEVAL